MISNSSEYIGKLLQQAFRGFASQMHKHLRAAGYSDLTPTLAEMLATIPQNGIRIIALAQAFGITKQAASEAIRQLQKNGYLHKDMDPYDARSVLIRLSPRGKQFMYDAHAMKAAIEAEYTQALGSANFDQLQQHLKALINLQSKP